MKKLLELRKSQRKPKFIRQDAHKKKRVGTKWRRPKGIQSKMRLKLKGYRRSISTGYKAPVAVRGLHKSGLLPIRIDTLTKLDTIDKEKQGIIIAKQVGLRKKVLIIKQAQTMGIRILNIKNIEDILKKTKELQEKKKDLKQEKKDKKNKKKDVKEKKKKTEEEKEEETKKEKEKILTKNK